MAARAGTVDLLVEQALLAFSHVDHTDAEALSAAFSLALQMIEAVKTHNPKYLETVRAASEALLLACADERVKH